MVYEDEAEVFLNPRSYPKSKVSLIRLWFDPNTKRHVLSAPGIPSVDFGDPKEDAIIGSRIKLWDVEVENGLDCGDEVASWLSDFITDGGTGLRLMKHSEK